MYNLLSGAGFDKGFFSNWSMCWLFIGLIFILCTILKKQAEDGFLEGMGFNYPACIGLGIGSAFIAATITGSPKWTLAIGIIGILAGGPGIGWFAGTE